jgi:hypothetical protein
MRMFVEEALASALGDALQIIFGRELIGFRPKDCGRLAFFRYLIS